MKVSKLLSRKNEWRWHGRNWRWVATHDGDDFIAVHLQVRMKSDDDVVREHTLWILFCSASFQWQFDVIARVAMSNRLASAVSVEIGISNAIKLFTEF